MVVEGQDVYIVKKTLICPTLICSTHCQQLDQFGDLHPLDESTAVPPTISGTWFLALVTSLFQKLIKRTKLPAHNGSAHESPEASDAEGYDSAGTASEAPGSGQATLTERAEGMKGRVATIKAGGKRRKAVRKR